MDFIELLKLLGIPIARGFLGWVENAVKDGSVSQFEWRELGATMIRILTLAGFGYFGFNGFGIDVDAVSVVAGSAVVDFIYTKMKSMVKKK